MSVGIHYYMCLQPLDILHCVFSAAVTRPLLRQIENLQSTFAAQTSSYERVEKNLTDRLSKHIFTSHR